MNEDLERLKIAKEVEIEKRLISECINRVHGFINSRTWEIFANKFRSLNVSLPADLVECRICEDPISGHYFQKEKKIILCANNVTKREFDFTVSHELVHVYDHARAEIDFTDPRHLACSEIRATNLSGECRPAKFYKFFTANENYDKCVRERASDSVSFNLREKITREEVEKTVDSVWEVCFFDYDPYTFEELNKKLKTRGPYFL